MNNIKETYLRQLLIDWLDYAIEAVGNSSLDNIINYFIDICNEADIKLDEESISYLKNEIKERGM